MAEASAVAIVTAATGGKLVSAHGFLDLDEALAEARAQAAAHPA